MLRGQSRTSNFVYAKFDGRFFVCEQGRIANRNVGSWVSQVFEVQFCSMTQSAGTQFSIRFPVFVISPPPKILQERYCGISTLIFCRAALRKFHLWYERGYLPNAKPNNFNTKQRGKKSERKVLIDFQPRICVSWVRTSFQAVN